MLKGPLDPLLINETSKWLQALGTEFSFTKADLYRVELCSEELVANIINYSDPRYANQAVELHAEIDAQKARLILIDPTDPFDPFSISPPGKAKSLEEMRVGGQGIPLVRKFCDFYRYEYKDGKNRVELIFELDSLKKVKKKTRKIPRQKDRRHTERRLSLSLQLDETDQISNKRKKEDRRALGFISLSQIFHDVPYSAVEDLIERLPIQTIAGEMLLLKPGDSNNTVLTLLEGKLKVSLDRPENGNFINIEVGACVGEMSVIDNQPASAYVIAEPGARLLIIDSDSFINGIMTIPLVSRNMLSAMSERMRRSNELTVKRMRKEMEMEQTQRELQFARSIQESLLPKEPLFADDGRLDCVGLMITAREVGGDFYDIFALDERYIFFAIADVCGKGLPASMFMVRAIAALRAQSGNEEQSPDYTSHLIARLNHQLCSYNDAQQFLTAFCGILDLKTLSLSYVNAGHNAPALAVGSEPFQFLSEPISPIVGMIKGMSYRAGEIKLKPGSNLLLYTDGVTEAEDKQGNMLGDDSLLTILNEAPSRNSRTLVDEIFTRVREFSVEAKQSDDITVLAIRCI